MRERSQAAEDEVARLMESDGASKHSWDKEVGDRSEREARAALTFFKKTSMFEQKAVFLERIEGEQQQLRAVKEAHEELRREHAELSSQAKVHAQHICESQVRDTHARWIQNTQVSVMLPQIHKALLLLSLKI